MARPTNVAPAEEIGRRVLLLACLGIAGCLPGAAPTAARSAGLAAPGGAAGQPEGPARPAGGLAPDQVYARVAPSVAYVETPLGSGSAVLVEPGLLLTNAHVVWPYDAARVVFADGTERAAVPVVAQDTIADLAALDLAAAGGPPPGVAPATVADGTALAIGTDLYLVGYPAETESFPQPALTRGILSRLRRWAAIDTTFLQTDADLAGGQSGGALVAPDGTVVGFSSMYLGESDFAVAMSAPDAVARLKGILAGGPRDGPAPRPIPLSGGTLVGVATLAAGGDEAAFVLHAAYGDAVDLSAEGRGYVSLRAIGPFGDIDLDVDDPNGGRTSGTVDILDDGPYFLVVSRDVPGEVIVRSSAPLVPYADPDDGAVLELGTTASGLMDYPGDQDTWRVHLDAGSSVTLTVDTINFSPDADLERANGDDSRLLDARLAGPLGLTLTAPFTPEVSGDYLVRIRDAAGIDTGGYFVRVE
ncbi:MAG: trypsin-like peptidase domain-containing protein [Deltaproteobacteria bacterium]|nr:trypsin-like peptidase domain-containing protein [Deltaproteobacteria bacterium]